MLHCNKADNWRVDDKLVNYSDEIAEKSLPMAVRTASYLRCFEAILLRCIMAFSA